jgi:saccharopine dehydrogenase-like NADP-dependent oxidoreductase
MKALVFGGSGKVGAAVAWDLLRQDAVEVVGIAGRRQEALEQTSRWLESEKARIHVLDVNDKQKTAQLMEKYDVGVSALPDRTASYRVAEAAIAAELSLVDMLEEYHRRPDPYETEGLTPPAGMSIVEYGEWLNEQAVKAGITFLSGIGFAPGLSNITLGEGIRKLDRAETAVARVGGIPAKEVAKRHPLQYMVTWAFDHVLREYSVKVPVLKGGQVVEVDALTDRERFRFTQFGKDEELECAITPGMPSFIYTHPELQEFAEKTVRWPGHFQAIDTLKECGLLDREPVEVDGVQVSPRELLLAMLEPRLRSGPGETDICVMWNTTTGIRGGKHAKINHYLWEEADTRNGISAMARVTGFPAAIAAVFLGEGKISERGIVAPEECITGELYASFMVELEKRNITVLERTATL